MSVVQGTAEATLRAIVAALVTEFGEPNVRRGRFPEPPGPFPFVGVAGAQVRSEQGPPRYWTRTATIDVDLWEAAGGLDPDSRVWLSEELADRARNRLEAAFADSTNELYLREDFAVESSALGNDLDLVPDGFARAFLVVTFGFRERGT